MLKTFLWYGCSRIRFEEGNLIFWKKKQQLWLLIPPTAADEVWELSPTELKNQLHGSTLDAGHRKLPVVLFTLIGRKMSPQHKVFFLCDRKKKTHPQKLFQVTTSWASVSTSQISEQHQFHLDCEKVKLGKLPTSRITDRRLILNIYTCHRKWQQPLSARDIAPCSPLAFLENIVTTVNFSAASLLFWNMFCGHSGINKYVWEHLKLQTTKKTLTSLYSGQLKAKTRQNTRDISISVVFDSCTNHRDFQNTKYTQSRKFLPKSFSFVLFQLSGRFWSKSEIILADRGVLFFSALHVVLCSGGFLREGQLKFLDKEKGRNAQNCLVSIWWESETKAWNKFCFEAQVCCQPQKPGVEKLFERKLDPQQNEIDKKRDKSIHPPEMALFTSARFLWFHSKALISCSGDASTSVQTRGHWNPLQTFTDAKQNSSDEKKGPVLVP